MPNHSLKGAIEQYKERAKKSGVSAAAPRATEDNSALKDAENRILKKRALEMEDELRRKVRCGSVCGCGCAYV